MIRCRSTELSAEGLYCEGFDDCISAGLLFGGGGVCVLDAGFVLGLGRLVQSVLHQRVSLHLLGFVVEQDSQEHHEGPDGGHQRDGVTEHDDAQPDGQSVLHRARHTAGGHTASAQHHYHYFLLLLTKNKAYGLKTLEYRKSLLLYFCSRCRTVMLFLRNSVMFSSAKIH